jgi:hypothetical protein
MASLPAVLVIVNQARTVGVVSHGTGPVGEDAENTHIHGERVEYLHQVPRFTNHGATVPFSPADPTTETPDVRKNPQQLSVSIYIGG